MAPIIPENLILKGRVVTLKALPQPDAYPRMMEILSDPKTMEHLRYMSHWTEESFRKRQENFLNDMKKDKGLPFVVYLTKTNDVIGNCGFTTLSLSHRFGISGRIIHYPFWGSGAATECNLLSWGYAIEKLNLHRIEFGTFKDNIRVHKSAERLGITLECVQKEVFCVNGQFYDNYVYAFFDRDWPRIKKKLEEKLERQIIKSTG